jgi:threonine dehydratase
MREEHPAADMNLDMPTFPGVLEARRRIAPYLPRTSLFPYPQLDRLVGTSVWVKHENHQPVGAFKVRGGVNLIAQLSDEERKRGVTGASTGNHGQSIAYAGRLFGVSATIYVPESANPSKVQSMEDLGAEVVPAGLDFDAARERCAAVAAETGQRYIHSGNEPLLIEGVGTYALEIFEDLPNVDVIIVPVGGGSGAAGVCLVAKTISPSTRVIGVQAEAAPAAYLSWKARSLVEDQMNTAAEGLATRTAFELPQRILWEQLDDFVLVSEEELRNATRTMIEATRNLVEGAGASAFAAALKIKDQLAGRRVAVICSGGNISPGQIAELFAVSR